MVPLVCQACGSWFALRIQAPAPATVTFEGSTAQCPKCRAWSAIPDGTYRLVGALLKRIEQVPASALQGLLESVQRAQGLATAVALGSQGESNVKALEAVLRTLHPTVAPEIPAPPSNASEVREWLKAVGPILAAVAALLAVLVNYLALRKSEGDKIPIEPKERPQVIERACRVLERSTAPSSKP